MQTTPAQAEVTPRSRSRAYGSDASAIVPATALTVKPTRMIQRHATNKVSARDTASPFGALSTDVASRGAARRSLRRSQQTERSAVFAAVPSGHGKRRRSGASGGAGWAGGRWRGVGLLASTHGGVLERPPHAAYLALFVPRAWCRNGDPSRGHKSLGTCRPAELCLVRLLGD